MSNNTNTSQLIEWTKKFFLPFQRLQNSTVQKITATTQGEVILSAYKPQDDKSLVILSMKKGNSGIFLSQTRPPTLPQPNSFVQIARKYLQGRKVIAVYATLNPIAIIIEFCPYSLETLKEKPELTNNPDCLILDLDSKPPRLVVAKKFDEIHKRYMNNYLKNDLIPKTFFESWCEWDTESTKTKKRSTFLETPVAFCPWSCEPLGNFTVDQIQQDNLTQKKDDTSNNNESKFNQLLLPSHIRKAVKTKHQFLIRRLQRQKEDLPTDKDIIHLKKQAEGLKNLLYLWPKNSSTWNTPPQFIEEYQLKPLYILKKGQTPGQFLEKIYQEVAVLERRQEELTKRIQENQRHLDHFESVLNLACIEMKDLFTSEHSSTVIPAQRLGHHLDQLLLKSQTPCVDKLCLFLQIERLPHTQQEKIKNQSQKKFPYKQFMASNGSFIRVARSAADGDSMIKLMPSHHTWLHVLSGEGSHVWLEKRKDEKKIPSNILREACILATHFSKSGKAQRAEVQLALRADIEKKKDLAPGKVLVRRKQTMVISYERVELETVLENSKNI